MTFTNKLIPALFSATLLFAAPAALADTEAEPVTFEIDVAASPEAMLTQIEDQAWRACRSERGDNSVSGRSHGQIRCARALVKQVIDNLNVEPLTVYAQTRGKLRGAS